MDMELISNIIRALKNFGVFIGGIGAFCAARSFNQYRLKERSEAAAKALIIFNNCINNVAEIEKRSGLYEYQGYYPDKIPEIPFKNSEQSWTRPFRLISNEKNKFKKEFQEAIVKIAGKEFSALNQLSDRIVQLISKLITSLPQETSDEELRKRSILEYRKQSQAWIDETNEVHREVEDILFSIINGTAWRSRICRTISFWFNNVISKFNVVWGTHNATIKSLIISTKSFLSLFFKKFQ